ncbi:hypothetical protein NDU88_002277 [Pleurodeles waltl]|uniref:Uncharacterized protein n=1 Tax=Pleurodeles waltl TaxID=8319 RepID=A0AAV7T2D5_PLEWA|nr:hypothetical protein NDU88_002277 [Pleurodeles waltl]
MFRPLYSDTPIHHLFRGGTNDIKSLVETLHRRETAHLWTFKEEPRHHGARIACVPHDLLPSAPLRTPTPAKTTTEEEAGDGHVSAVDPVDSEDEEAEDEDNRSAIIRQYFQ